MKKPKRIFRRPQMPPIPPEADKLRDVRKAVVPWQTYQMQLPDGSVIESTGEELIRLADGMTALVDAQRRGDEEGIRRAVLSIEAMEDSFAPPVPPPGVVEATEHNYREKVERFARENHIPPGRLSEIGVFHDDWCGIYRGGICNCDPDIRLLKTHPKPPEKT